MGRTVIKKCDECGEEYSLEVKVRNRKLREKKDPNFYCSSECSATSQRKWERVEKECPVCEETFIARKNHPKEKTTCSKSCAMSHFKSGENNPNWKSDSIDYRKTCYEYHEKKCVVCGEDKVLDVHHYDGDSNNNKPENLIPLCPTHHRYIHNGYEHLIEDKIESYRKRFMEDVV